MKMIIDSHVLKLIETLLINISILGILVTKLVMVHQTLMIITMMMSSIMTMTMEIIMRLVRLVTTIHMMIYTILTNTRV